MAKRTFKNSNTKTDVVVTNDSNAVIVNETITEDTNKEVEPHAEEVQEQTPEAVPEPTWEETLVKDLNETILKFLPVSKQAGWAVKYINPVLESYENGSVKLDENSYIGATLYIQFDFDNEYKK